MSAPAEQAFRNVCAIGGERGWRAWQWAWVLRGWLDRLVGGPGLSRGRRHPVKLLPGDTLDFWRVEELEAPRLLRLRAEMRVPGEAWLEFEVQDRGEGCHLVQRALFRPRGWPGLLYWYLLWPIHRFLFTHLVEALKRDAETDAVPGD